MDAHRYRISAVAFAWKAKCYGDAFRLKGTRCPVCLAAAAPAPYRQPRVQSCPVP